MKKFLKILIILILLGIIGFCLYKFVFEKNLNSSSEDFSKIKKYLSDIYGRTFLIPEFEDINEASEEWLWENVNQYLLNHDDEYHEKNSQEYGYSYDDISKIVKILYGDDLNKKFPKGAISMRYDPYHELYGPTSYGSDFYYNYHIDKITKSGNIYKVSLYDYTISTYFSQGNDNDENNDYTIYNNYEYNLNWEEGTPIIAVPSLKDKKFENILDQKDKLSHKILTIELDEATNLFHIKSCEYKETKPEELLSMMYQKMKMSFEISSIDYDRDEIYYQDEILVENFDELSEIFTENSLETYKNEMDLFVFKDDGQVYITAGDITVGEYLVKTEFKDIKETENEISAIAVRTFREDWNTESEGYNNLYQKEDSFKIIKKDGKWYIDQFNYNN